MKTTGYSVATAYQHTHIVHADPVQLVVLLYDGALSRIAEARQRFQEGNRLQAELAVTKAQAIIHELRNTLNREEGGEVAENLHRLYLYIHDRLVACLLDGRPEPLNEASALLEELRGAWAEIARQYKEQTDRDRPLDGVAVRA
jgi:flagellar protein FliS